MKRVHILLILMALSLLSCKNNHKSDAYGNFEAKEIIISSESNGKLLLLNLEEGKTIEAEKIAGIVDTTSLYLQKQQLVAKKEAIGSKISNILAQIEVQKQQKRTLLKESQGIKGLPGG